jgi:hypothetical protein
MGTVRAFLYWLAALPESLEAGAKVMTSATWPAWRLRATTGDLTSLKAELADVGSEVHYPADGMAYVFALIPESGEHSEAAQADPNPTEGRAITLLFEGEEWRVHSVGPMVTPAELAKVPYSW